MPNWTRNNREPETMLKGKWALVTGATAGLGLAVAESLAGAGANIVLHDLVEPAQTRDRLRAQFGVEVVSIAADLSQRAAIEADDGRPARPHRRGRYPGEQRGGAAFFAGRKLPAGTMGRSARRQSVGPVPPDPSRIARDEEREAGAASSTWPRSIRPAPSRTASIT